MIVDAEPDLIRSEFERLLNSHSELEYPGFYGDGKASEFILKEIILMLE